MGRTIKSVLAEGIGTDVNLDMAIIPWLVRHAAYIITRCRVRSHGRTSLQLITGRNSLTELVAFGETVVFNIPKTKDVVGSSEERWETGVWIGCTIRDGMALIGTPAGVYKVGALKRQPDGEQWSKDTVNSIVGSPHKPQPDVNNRRITTFAKKKLDGGDQPLPRCQPPTEAGPVPRNVL